MNSRTVRTRERNPRLYLGPLKFRHWKIPGSLCPHPIYRLGQIRLHHLYPELDNPSSPTSAEASLEYRCQPHNSRLRPNFAVADTRPPSTETGVPEVKSLYQPQGVVSVSYDDATTCQYQLQDSMLSCEVGFRLGTEHGVDR